MCFQWIRTMLGAVVLHAAAVNFIIGVEMTADAYRVNCGATGDVQVDGWLQDQEFSDGVQWGYQGGGMVTREADLPIHAGELSEIVRSEHCAAKAYHFALNAGSYEIRLIAAITFEGDIQPDKELHASIGEQQICSGLDIFKEAGGFNKPVIAVLRGYRHAGGQLTIRFDRPSNINGIEITGCDAVEPTVSIEAPYRDQQHPQHPQPPQPAEKKRHYKMLFIGNSGTFFWAIPETTQALLRNGPNDVSIDVEGLFSGGKRFEWHFTKSRVLEKIKNNNYDIVVLQDSSSGPLDFSDSMQEYGAKLIAAVKAAGARPILYAYEGPERYGPEQRLEAMNQYLKLARAHDVAVVPGAMALDKAMQALPDTNFHNPDRHHLGMYAGYLMSCCFYEVLSGQSAEYHPYPAVLGDHVLIPEDKARILERCAHEACVAYKP